LVTPRANALGDYLRARREQLCPEDVGLVAGTRRRVAGLRREEVATLAGISSAYYLRLEQGRDIRPSGQVVDALARALRLDLKATEYLHGLASPTGIRGPESTASTVSDKLRELIDQIPFLWLWLTSTWMCSPPIRVPALCRQDWYRVKTSCAGSSARQPPGSYTWIGTEPPT
jgi:transcriptional regulator with XRE-family HTH domain